MGYPQLRSMNGDLNEGATDGKYKKVLPNVGGIVDPARVKNRRDLSDVFYGTHETQPKVRPDGVVVDTPNYVATAPVRGIW